VTDNSAQNPVSRIGNPPAKVDLTKLPPERARASFRALILANPNYFGNVTGSQFKPVLNIVSDTTYEELHCVGFQPALNRLEAVVHVNQSTGYGGDVCSSGSREYVRFYLSYDNGATWQDQGSVSFAVYDVPGNKPLEYAATLELQPPPAEKLCFIQNLPKVRAILSWNNDPPPNTPAFTPVWGNVVDAHIQIEGLDLIVLADVLQEANVSLPIELASSIDLSQSVHTAKAKALSAGELVALYQGTKVPSHRFLFAEFQQLLAHPPLTQTLMTATPSLPLAGLGVNVGDAVAGLLGTSGDTTYEELDCVGLDFNRDAVVGVLKVKQPGGYLGGPCTAGSQEYVAFWVDWGDGKGWTYAGTASVSVHDFSSIPLDGLEYSVYLPVDIVSHMQPCGSGAKTARVRAILSWETPPPPSNPDYVPVWGNRDDTLVLVRPGTAPTACMANISIIGGIGIGQIDTGSTGYTVPNALFALQGTPADPWVPARQCPFGARIVIQGYPCVGYKYRVKVRDVTAGGLPIILTDQIWTVDNNGNGTWRSPDGSGFFTYVGTSDNIDNVLAYWDSSGDDLWEVMLELADASDNVLNWTPQYRVQLDNTAPIAAIHIDSGGDCKQFTAGATINGHFVAQDANFGVFGLSTLPASVNPNEPTTATPATSETAPSPGNPWQLNTDTPDEMPPCGYVVHLDVWDRSILNSAPGNHNYNSADVGFCLLIS